MAERVTAKFYDDSGRMTSVQPTPYVVASLDKTLYDDYLCLVASNKQQMHWKKTQKNPLEYFGNAAMQETPEQVQISPNTK